MMYCLLTGIQYLHYTVEHKKWQIYNNFAIQTKLVFKKFHNVNQEEVPHAQSSNVPIHSMLTIL